MSSMPMKSNETEIISPNENSYRSHPIVFKMAVLDGSVACCPHCGCAMKPPIVLYGEEVNVDC